MKIGTIFTRKEKQYISVKEEREGRCIGCIFEGMCCYGHSCGMDHNIYKEYKEKKMAKFEIGNWVKTRASTLQGRIVEVIHENHKVVYGVLIEGQLTSVHEIDESNLELVCDFVRGEKIEVGDSKYFDERTFATYIPGSDTPYYTGMRNIVGWKRARRIKQTKTITIDGKDIEMSKESFDNLKEFFKKEK